MHPVLFKIGSIPIYSWGFMLAIAVIVSVYGVGRLFEQEGYDKNQVVDLVLVLVIVGVIGSRIAHILVYERAEFIANPLSVLSVSGGISGLIWYGGLIAAVIPFVIYIKKNNWNFWRVADMLAPFVALGYAIVRIGCFLNGCCYGAVTNSACGVVFPYVDNFTRFPTQIYSSLINLFLFGLLIWFYPRRQYTGQVFSFYLIGYAIYRFIIEIFRESTIMYGPLTLGQVYTLILLVIGIILWLWRRKVNERS